MALFDQLTSMPAVVEQVRGKGRRERQRIYDRAVNTCIADASE